MRSKTVQKYDLDKLLDTMEDAEVLSDIIKLCWDGGKLYRFVATRVERQRLRNMFSDMARVRLEIAMQLEAEFAQRAIEGRRGESSLVTTLAIDRWYVDARSRFSDFTGSQFIEQLEETEDSVLDILRSAIRKVGDRSLVLKLSSVAATFQISHDRMRAIIKL